MFKTMHPTQPYPSMMSARTWSTAVFLLVLGLSATVLLEMYPPIVWSAGIDSPVALSLSDLLVRLVNATDPGPGRMDIGRIANYPFHVWAQFVSALPSQSLVPPTLMRLAVAICIALAAAIPVHRRVRDETPKAIDAEHVSGPQPKRGAWGKNYLNQSWDELRRQTGTGVMFSPGVVMPCVTETQGTLLIGPPGSGKSVILEGLLMQALARRHRVVCLDVKGGLARRIASRRPKMLDLSGGKSVVWAIGSDLHTDADADEFAASLIPESKDPVWSEGSRLILSALVQYLGRRHGRRWGWKRLYQLLTQPVDEMERTIEKLAPEVANMIRSRGGEPATFVLSLVFNLIAHVGATARRFATMEDQGARRLSLRSWATGTGPRSPIVLRYDLQRRERSASFVRLALRLLSGTLLGAEVEDGLDTHTWVFLDEVTRIGRCDAVTDLASLGRSRGIRSVASVQSPAQLRDVYGEAGSEAFRENFGLQIVCGLPPGDNARRVATEWVAARMVCERAAMVKPGDTPREWSLPPISASEYAADFGLRFNIWGRPYIRAAVLGLGDIPVIDWPIHRWPPRG